MQTDYVLAKMKDKVDQNKIYADMLVIEAEFKVRNPQHLSSPLQCYQATLMVEQLSGLHVTQIAPGQGKSVDILLAATWLKRNRDSRCGIATINEGLKVQMHTFKEKLCPNEDISVIDIKHLNENLNFDVVFCDEADEILSSHLFHMIVGQSGNLRANGLCAASAAGKVVFLSATYDKNHLKRLHTIYKVTKEDIVYHETRS